MVKRFSISIDDWIAQTYLSEPTHNQSAYISKLIVAGSEALLKDPDLTNKSRIIQLLTAKEELERENKQLKYKITQLQDRVRPQGRVLNPDTENDEFKTCISCKTGINLTKGQKGVTYYKFNAGLVCKTCYNQYLQEKFSEWSRPEALK